MSNENESQLPESLSSFLNETAKQNNPLELKPAEPREFNVAVLFPNVVNPQTMQHQAFPANHVSFGSIIDAMRECFISMDKIGPRHGLPEAFAISLVDADSGAKFLATRENGQLNISDEKQIVHATVPLRG